MLLSISPSKSSIGMAFTAIGSCTFTVRCTPAFIGKEPYFNNFQELLMVTGTTRASGIFFNNIFKPVLLKTLGAPVLLRVPSGNITAER